jgi:hypothetical protein
MYKSNITSAKHGDFLMRPGTHLQGKGCLFCTNIVRNSIMNKKWFDKPTALYYVKITKNNTSVWKIGVAINVENVKDRFYREDIDVLDVKYYISGKYAYEEQRILEEFSEKNIMVTRLLVQGILNYFTKT